MLLVLGLLLLLVVAVVVPYLPSFDPAPGQRINQGEGLIVVPLLLGYASLAVGVVLLVVAGVRRIGRARS